MSRGALESRSSLVVMRVGLAGASSPCIESDAPGHRAAPGNATRAFVIFPGGSGKNGVQRGDHSASEG